jgi:hypothetical protein
VTGFTPASLKQDQHVHGELSGMNLDDGAPYRPVIHLIQEARFDSGVTREVIGFNVSRVSATHLSGTLHVPAGARRPICDGQACIPGSPIALSGATCHGQ